MIPLPTVPMPSNVKAVLCEEKGRKTKEKARRAAYHFSTCIPASFVLTTLATLHAVREMKAWRNFRGCFLF